MRHACVRMGFKLLNWTTSRSLPSSGETLEQRPLQTDQLSVFFRVIDNLLTCKLVEKERHLPIGLMSKNWTGVCRMALNMPLCRFWADFTRTLKKSKQRRKPNTTEAAVKPDKSTGGKKTPSAQYNAILVPTIQGHHALKGLLLSILNEAQKEITST